MKRAGGQRRKNRRRGCRGTRRMRGKKVGRKEGGEVSAGDISCRRPGNPSFLFNEIPQVLGARTGELEESLSRQTARRTFFGTWFFFSFSPRIFIVWSLYKDRVVHRNNLLFITKIDEKYVLKKFIMNCERSTIHCFLFVFLFAKVEGMRCTEVLQFHHCCCLKCFRIFIIWSFNKENEANRNNWCLLCK